MPRRTLIVCRDCRSRVSARAKACPHCGAPTRSETERVARVLLRVFFWVASGLAMLWLVLMILSTF